MTRTLAITGMTCGHCQQAVTKALLGVPGVTGARVELAGGRAVVDGDAPLEALTAAVEDAGYAVQPAETR